MTEEVVNQATEIIEGLNSEDPEAEKLQHLLSVISEGIDNEVPGSEGIQTKLALLKKEVTTAEEEGGLVGRGKKLAVTDYLLRVLLELREIRSRQQLVNHLQGGGWLAAMAPGIN